MVKLPDIALWAGLVRTASEGVLIIQCASGSYPGYRFLGC